MSGSVTSNTVDADALGAISVMKKTAGGNTELYIPLVYKKRKSLSQFETSQKPHNGKYKSFYWLKRAKQNQPLPKSKKERNKKSPMYWRHISNNLDFKDFLPFSTIIKHKNLIQPDKLFNSNV